MAQTGSGRDKRAPPREGDGGGLPVRPPDPTASGPEPSLAGGALARALFEALRDALILFGPDGRILDVNRAYTEMTGFSREEVLGIAEPFPHGAGGAPETAASPVDSISGEFDLAFRRKSGERFPVIVSVTTVRDRRDRVAAHVWVVKDASARERVESAVRRQSAAMDASVDGMAIHDREGRFVYLNEAHARLYGYPGPPALLGKTWRVLYNDRELRRFDAEIMPAIAARGRWRGEATGRRADGASFPQELSLTALDDGGLVCVVRDVTERKADREAFLGVQERLRTVVSNAPIVLWALDADGVVTLSEGKGLEALDIRPGENVGKSIFTLYPEVPQIAASARRALAGESFGETTRFRDRVFETRYVPLRDEHGRVTGALGLATDVTEARRATEAMLHAQKLESLGVLAGGIAHDFNNLLVGILGNAGLALLEIAPDAPARRIVEQIELGAQRAAELTRQLLAYTGKGAFVVERLDLSAIARETIRLQQVAVAKDARLEHDLPDGLPPVEGDAAQLGQVVMNLVGNASDALAGRPGTIRVSTRATHVDASAPTTVHRVPELRSGEYVCLEVADTGCGMDAATRARIFDPFFTTKFAGRGLGLAVVLGIVRGHDGAIEVESAPGRGSTFRVLLPAASGVRVERRGASSSTPGEAGLAGGGTVLVVDDEADVRTVVTGMLRHLGFSTATAADGLEGADAFAARPDAFVAVVLDLTMPRMGGEEALRRIRRARADVPVLLMSGYDERDAVSRFLDGGPDAFLQKPFSIGDLATRLRALFTKPPRG
jgi:PAS domain S-box-containing protein